MHTIKALAIVLCFACSAQAADLAHNCKLLAYCGIGNGATTEANPRAINPGTLPDCDWGKFWEGQQTLADSGLKRWVLWMPFGRDDTKEFKALYGETGFRPQWFVDRLGKPSLFGSNLRIDQYSLAKADTRYKRLIDTWPATQLFLAGDDEREVICYLGTVIGAPEFDANTASVESLTKRMDAELAPYIDAGCSLAFDASALLTKEHWFFGYMQTLKARGVRVYIEAWPYHGYDHLTSEHAIATTDMLKNYKPGAYGPGGFMDPKLMTGERQAWLVQHPPEGTKIVDWYKQIIPAMLADESIDSVACYAGWYVKEGGKLEELSERETDWRGMLGGK